jgi:hypothetical protein
MACNLNWKRTLPPIFSSRCIAITLLGLTSLSAELDEFISWSTCSMSSLSTAHISISGVYAGRALGYDDISSFLAAPPNECHDGTDTSLFNTGNSNSQFCSELRFKYGCPSSTSSMGSGASSPSSSSSLSHGDYGGYS